MSSPPEIERLRLRAAFCRREAAMAMADYRARFIYCQALAQHLEDEAAALERAPKSDRSSKSHEKRRRASAARRSYA